MKQRMTFHPLPSGNAGGVYYETRFQDLSTFILYIGD